MKRKNAELYERADIVSIYANVRGLLPPEKYLFGRYIKPGSDVLDVGVGGGRTAAYLSTGARRYLGIDYSPEMVEASRKRYPHLSFEQGDATNLSSIADESFDAVVFSFNGIDCLDTDEARIRAMREFRRIVRPKGVVILSSHNARHLFVYPLLAGAPIHKKAWRVIRAAAKSVPLAARNLRGGLYKAGRGYTIDPVHGGHYMHASTPESMAEDAAEAGLRIVEHVGALYPKRLPDTMNSWETYALVRA